MSEFWSYGVTTVPQRVNNLLPRTLASLAAAGFNSPHLFIDGLADAKGIKGITSVSQRDQQIGAFGSWILAAWELYIRSPQSRLYAIFQDDLIMCKGVKEYLEQFEYPKDGYLNLFTFASNEIIISTKPKGWHKSDQTGKGAVALVFSHEVMYTLLQQSHMVNKPQLPKGHKNIDGAVSHALVTQAHLTEYIHKPSLVQHIGCVSTLDNPKHPDAKTFPGEGFNVVKEMV